MKPVVISLTLLFALAALANAEPYRPLPPREQAAKDACTKKLDLIEEKLHKSKESGEVGKDRSCFMACVSKELGIITADGNIDKEEAVKIFPPHVSEENRTKIVDACYQKKGADDCETAGLYYACAEKLIPRRPKSPESRTAYDSCKAELGLTDEDLEKRGTEKEPKEDCFVLCIGKNVGFVNEDGSLNIEFIVTNTPPHMKEDAQKFSEECAKEEAASECEFIILVYECFRKNHFSIDHLYGVPHPHP